MSNLLIKLYVSFNHEENPSIHQCRVLTDGIVLGRANKDLRFVDPLISSRHAVIYESKPNELRIKDLKSKNGTYVNGQQVTDSAINPGDIVTLGKTEVTIGEVKGNNPVLHGWPNQFHATPKEKK